jgi:hypothetical protein
MYKMKSETSLITPIPPSSESKEKERCFPRMPHYGRQACALGAKTLSYMYMYMLAPEGTSKKERMVYFGCVKSARGVISAGGLDVKPLMRF